MVQWINAITESKSITWWIWFRWVWSSPSWPQVGKRKSKWQFPFCVVPLMETIIDEKHCRQNMRRRKPRSKWQRSTIFIPFLVVIAIHCSSHLRIWEFHNRTYNNPLNQKPAIANFSSLDQMGRRQSDAERGVCALAIVFLMGVSSCIMVFRCLIGAIRPTSVEVSSTSDFVNYGGDFKSGEHNEECCRGIEHLELWGDAVKWGSDFKLNSSRECCLACKAMCDDQSGGCFCDSWVFCGDAKACGPMFGEVWLRTVTFLVFWFSFIVWFFVRKFILRPVMAA